MKSSQQSGYTVITVCLLFFSSTGVSPSDSTPAPKQQKSPTPSKKVSDKKGKIISTKKLSDKKLKKTTKLSPISPGTSSPKTSQSPAVTPRSSPPLQTTSISESISGSVRTKTHLSRTFRATPSKSPSASKKTAKTDDSVHEIKDNGRRKKLK